MKKLPVTHALAEAHFHCMEDPFTGHNPDGYINLGTAEHVLFCQEIHAFLKNAPFAEPEDFQYQCLHGKPETRESVASWLTQKAGRRLDPEKVVLASGTTAILEALGFALCDPGDFVLIPSPCYPGFRYDLEEALRRLSEFLNKGGHKICSADS